VTDEPPSPTLELTDAPDPKASEVFTQGLRAYNEGLFGPSDLRPLAVLVRSHEDGEVVGGLWGRTGFRWLFVDYLYLPEVLRGRRLGEELLRLAEAEARRRGCIGAWLDTLNPRARPFYERQGYEVFGKLDDYPPGNPRWFLCKRLAE
jgi:GNAT superfamily N-acetyltransferase